MFGRALGTGWNTIYLYTDMQHRDRRMCKKAPIRENGQQAHIAQVVGQPQNRTQREKKVNNHLAFDKTLDYLIYIRTIF
uniref:Uncharacterized protein n=1 Tax=Acrobeloides nanus TaxID=290746 RepID=A0A914E639_9BILA